MARGPLKPDSWYEQQGVQPPDHITHHGSDRVREDGHTHDWEVRGPFLHCRAGAGYEHGIPYNHLEQRFDGTSPEGAPLFKPIVLSNNLPHNAN